MQCRDVDQPAAALVRDLKNRGLLDETLVVWGGEFGRTVYRQGPDAHDYGRDHHPRCFTVWMAGGGVKAGITHGETDDFSYNVVRDPVHIRDLNATILHCVGSITSGSPTASRASTSGSPASCRRGWSKRSWHSDALRERSESCTSG